MRCPSVNAMMGMMTEAEFRGWMDFYGAEYEPTERTVTKAVSIDSPHFQEYFDAWAKHWNKVTSKNNG